MRYTLTPLYNTHAEAESGFDIIDTTIEPTARNAFGRVGGFQSWTEGQHAAFFPDTDAAELLGLGCPRGLSARKTKHAVRQLLANR